jgi:hypothetical protein
MHHDTYVTREDAIQAVLLPLRCRFAIEPRVLQLTDQLKVMQFWFTPL